MNNLLNKKIPYRAIPISLESDPIWISLSLKRRALFLFLASYAVSSEIHIYQGKTLTFGQFVWSYPRLTREFNSTLHPEDHYSQMGCHKAIDFLVKSGFLKTEKWGTSVKSETVITILHSDTLELIKDKRCKANDVECKASVKQMGGVGVKQNNEQKPVLNYATIDNSERENKCSVNIENIVNIEECKAKQNLQELTLMTLFRKDNVMSMPFSKKEIDDVDDNILKKFKLTAEQIENFYWLKEQKIDSTIQTLSYWAKNYSLKRLKEVHKAAVKTKPQQGKTKSVGALMNHFLKKEIILETESRNENKEFMEAFRERCPEMHWKIEKKFVTCEINGITKEVFLDIHPHVFVDQLLLLEKQFKEA